MSSFGRFIAQSFKGAVGALKTFPAAIGHGAAFTAVTLVRIQLDWPQQEAWNFLFNCLHWAFALGAVFSLAAITAAAVRSADRRMFLVANLTAVAVSAVTFVLLYLFGGTVPDGGRFAMVSGIAATRVSAGMFLCLLGFIVLAASGNRGRSDIARSLFMVHKGFFIALIYGLVIMGGTSGVAGAVQGLLYQGMSGKVYMYIAALSGFLAFTIFVGYFPDFHQDAPEEDWETAQKQPRFIEILFGAIMVPIVLALTLVLLVWAGRTVAAGTWPRFEVLASITTSFVAGGVWLHIMVTHHDSALAVFYRKVYPVAALIILGFSVWALVVQLGRSGLQLTEYSFSLLWLFAGVSAALLIIRQQRAHLPMVALIGTLAVFAVLPVLGYHALPVRAQIARLEGLLVSQNMLVENTLVPAPAEPDREVRASITDAVLYLSRAEQARLPEWFDPDLQRMDVFGEAMGFEQVWPEFDPPMERYMGTSLSLPSGALDISGYRWAVQMQDRYAEGGMRATVDGRKGSYLIQWKTNPPYDVPELIISLDGRVILDEDMNPFIDRTLEAYPPGSRQPVQAELEDMILTLESPDVEVLLVFRFVEIYADPRQDTLNYFLDLNTLYLNESS